MSCSGVCKTGKVSLEQRLGRLADQTWRGCSSRNSCKSIVGNYHKHFVPASIVSPDVRTTATDRVFALAAASASGLFRKGNGESRPSFLCRFRCRSWGAGHGHLEVCRDSLAFAKQTAVGSHCLQQFLAHWHYVWDGSVGIVADCLPGIQRLRERDIPYLSSRIKRNETNDGSLLTC